MSNIANVQYEMMTLKKLIESKNPELLAKIGFDLMGNAELANIYKLVGHLYSDNGAMPSFDLLSAELANRCPNPEKQRFYTELIADIKDKDAAGITTEDLISKLKTQRQFRVVLDATGKLVDAVEKRDADETVGIMRELWEDMFSTEAAEAFDDADMVNMAGKTVQYDFNKTGFADLDKRGAWIACGLMGVGGESKAGKSLFSQQVMDYCHLNYPGSSAYYSYEQGPQELRARSMSAKSGIDIGLITSNLMNPEQRLLLRISEVAFLCEFNDNMKDFCMQTKSAPDEEFWPLFWNHFQPRQNRFYLPAYGGTWDQLFLHMKMLVDLKGVKRFCIDYPALVPRGSTDKQLPQWEYTLAMSRKLKGFARENDVRILTPMQYDAKNDNLRFAQNVICDMDLLLTMKQTEEDQMTGDTITVGYKAFRNFLSLPGEPNLQPFQLRKRFNICKFEDFSF